MGGGGGGSIREPHRNFVVIAPMIMKFGTSIQFDVHSPREIISTMTKTGQDALRKRKPCRNLFIHISNKSASYKLKNVSMESSKLLCFDGISFCSKSCKLITFPFSIASVLTLVMDGPRP